MTGLVAIHGSWGSGVYLTEPSQRESLRRGALATGRRIPVAEVVINTRTPRSVCAEGHAMSGLRLPPQCPVCGCRRDVRSAAAAAVSDLRLPPVHGTVERCTTSITGS